MRIIYDEFFTFRESAIVHKWPSTDLIFFFMYILQYLLYFHWVVNLHQLTITSSFPMSQLRLVKMMEHIDHT